MNFTPSRQTLNVEKHEKSTYDHDLQLYREIPDIHINLDEFEEYAIERLKGKNNFIFNSNYSSNTKLFLVLQILEQLSLKGNTNSYEDYCKSVIQELKKEGLKHMYKLVC